MRTEPHGAVRWFLCAVFSFSLFFPFTSTGQVLRVDPELASLVRAVRAENNGAEALDFVAGVYRTDRWSNFAKFQETAVYLQNTLRAIGLSSVELGADPADGVTQYGFWTMPLAWDVKRARLEVVEPAVPADLRVLADYEKEPASLIMWSGPTAPSGIIADVVELKPATLNALQNIDVKGKMVLTVPPLGLAQRGALKAALFRAGAAGMISCATENEDLTNSHYWMNAWGDFGWGFTKTSSPLVGFSITPQQGHSLSNLLAQGNKLRVKAVADTRYYSGVYPSLTATIPGTGPSEEVLELGHAFELGAQDNATGVAAMLEAMATLQRLIASGKLARPARTIRILIMSEDYGSSGYVATHMDRMHQTIGAICLDTAAGTYTETGGFNFALNPDVSRSYQDALVMRVSDSYYAGLKDRYPRWSPYRARSDSYLSDPMIGVPTVAPSGSSGTENLHHNGADTLEHVDPRSLRDLSSLVAIYLYYLATAGDSAVPWLAEITSDRAEQNSLTVAGPFLSRIESAEDANALRHALSDGFEQISYNSGLDSQAVLSVLRLASPVNRGKLHNDIGSVLDRLHQIADGQRARLQAAANRRAATLGIAVPVQPLPTATNLKPEASRLIVKRKRFGPVTLDDVPLDKREGYPGFGDSPAPLTLLYWCDGKRTIAEVARLLKLEQGLVKFDLLGYYKFLAKQGYIDLVPAPANQ